MKDYCGRVKITLRVYKIAESSAVITVVIKKSLPTPTTASDFVPSVYIGRDS